MVREFFTGNDDNVPAVIEAAELKYLQNKGDFIKPEIANMLDGLTENNVYEVTRQIIEDPETKIILKTQVVNRILNLEPVSADDVRAYQNNNPSWSTVSDITGNDLGIFRPQDVVYRDNMIFLQTRNIVHQATHYISIPKDILIDILRTAFLGTPSTLNMKVPISERQRKILDKILATINPEK